MKYTNKHMLPGILARALERNDHKQEGKYSVSQLVDPPQIVQLTKRHSEKLVKDVSDNLWSLLGTAVHWIIEQNGGSSDLVEKHLVIEVDGVTISGTPDHFNIDTLALNDWKTTAIYKFMKGGSEDWAARLNIYARMIKMKLNLQAKKLTNHLILRDWQRNEAKYKPGYPKVPFGSIEQELWPAEVTDALIHKRLQMHETAAKLKDEELPECTREEIWQKDDAWAVKKTSASSRAINGGVFYGPAAEVMAREVAQLKKGIVEHRPAERTRCEHFCAVKDFCVQFRKAKQTEAVNA